MGAIVHHVDDWRAETGEQLLHLLARQPVQLHAAGTRAAGGPRGSRR